MDGARLVIRSGGLDERYALEALQRRASLVWEEYRDAILAHADVIALPDSDFREGDVGVAEAGDGVLGFAIVLPSSPTAAVLDGLFVEPRAMRRGVGRALIEDEIVRARGRGVARIDVVANPRAEAFYAKVGFVVVGATGTRCGPAIQMTRGT